MEQLPLPDRDETLVPCLAAHARLRWDELRRQWVLLLPERILILDEITLDILERCDGTEPLHSILDDLAAEYDSGREVIADDVWRLLQQLKAKGALTFQQTAAGGDVKG